MAAALFLLSMLVGCAGNQEQVKKDAKASYELGLAFLSEARYAPALREFSKAETLTPDDPELLNALGITYWARREQGLAEEKFKKAVSLKPDYSEAWNNLGALYIDEGRYGDAIPALQNALKNVFYGTQERALANLGWALFKVGRVAEGERKLKEAIEAAPSFPLAHKNLGIVYQAEGKHQEALDQLREAARLMPNDAEIPLKEGLSLLKLGERPEARQAFEKAWHLAPGSEVGKSAKTYLDFLE
jgi:type IV pilus assembly protein PilF